MKLMHKIKSIIEYISLMGLKWFLFRLKYEVLKKVNYFDKINADIKAIVKGVEVSLFRYQKMGLIKSDMICNENFIVKADKAMEGKIFAFSSDYLNYREKTEINWQINPISKIQANDKMPWNKLPDFGEYGDIKLIWEASRFPQVYYFIHAYSSTKDEKYAKACIYQIIHWIKSNPFPYGVNYKCGQEITFRIFAWINALEFFTKFITDNDMKMIVENIYISFLRINANIDYAAKSVKNNHSISEASGLLVISLLFPQFKESEQLKKKAIRYLLMETEYQVYTDGSYIQHSFNYQRLVLDVLSYVFLVADKTECSLPSVLKKRHYSMVVFLHSLKQENGFLPNYGSNDGAKLFPVTANDYRDYRDSIDFALGYSHFFDVSAQGIEKIEKKVEFRDGGYYILKNKELFSFIRAHKYRDRPAQNDMFHLDIWYKEENIFCDSGSYSYNTEKEFKNNFLGNIGHNTLMINNQNQMKQVLNFGYTNWTDANCVEYNTHYFRGDNNAYLNQYSIIHTREVILEKSKIIVRDTIKNIHKMTNIKQIWNTQANVKEINSNSLEVSSCCILSNLSYYTEKSYISDYYNTYKEGKRIIFEIDTDRDCTIETILNFKGSK